MLLEILAIILGGIHFGIPLAYFEYLRRQTGRSWGLKVDPDYASNVSILIPTFQEARLIERKLSDIKSQTFPRDKVEVILIDSGSTDGTVEIASAWAMKNPEIKFNVVRESERTGKANALNLGLAQTNSEIIITTEPDSFWSAGSLSFTTSYFADGSVGAVTGLKVPLNSESGVESFYREFYNIVRLGESKVHSTPIFNGELAAYRGDLLRMLGGFPVAIGADDSYTATSIGILGSRAIAIPEAQIIELTPLSRSGYLRWKKRRAVHLIQHFSISVKKVGEASQPFRTVLEIEAFLHIVNPWLLLSATGLFLLSMAANGISPTHAGVLLIFAGGLIIRKTRAPLTTWITEQGMLIAGGISGLFSKELLWQKMDETRIDQ